MARRIGNETDISVLDCVCGAGTRVLRTERWLRLERAVNTVLLNGEIAEATLVAALRTVCESEHWAAGYYWRLDPAGGVLRIHAAWSADDARLQEILKQALRVEYRSGIGLVGHVLETRAPVWVPDLGHESRAPWKEQAARTGWNSALLVPVLVQAQVIGVMEFHAGQMAEPDDQLLAMVDALGRHIGSFWARAVSREGLRGSEDRYATLVELAPIGISHVDASGRFVYVNPQLCAMLGYSREELLQLSVRQISHPDDRFVTHKGLAQLRAGEINSFKVEKRYVRKDGTPLWVHVTIATKPSAHGQPLHDVSIVEDISARREAQARIEYLATHDAMTWLANRTLFNELLARATARARRYGGRLAVLFVDLDRFKIVNDSLGHDGGDELLRVMASRFRAIVRSSDAIARFGGDEFVLLVDMLPNREGAAVLARHLLSAAIQPVQIGQQQCRVTASVGIAVYPEDARDAVTLLKNADLALYGAKEQGKNTFEFYSPHVGAVAAQQDRIETCLREAIARDELSLH